MISEIQHFTFCRRQWALIHLEQQWAENVFTVEGNILHERTHDESLRETRGDVITTRGMRVVSHTLRVTGACDVVEFHLSPHGVSLFGREGLYLPCPIEYKRGKPKEHSADELQLCTQAICLEEMLCCPIPHGFLYYDQPHRRTKVEFTDELRRQVAGLFSEIYTLAQRGHTPKVKTGSFCKSCSLKDVCLPKLSKNASAKEYMAQRLREVD